MAVKKRDTHLNEDIEKVFDEGKSDRPAILGGAKADSAKKEKETPSRKKKAFWTPEQRKTLHPVQTYLTDEDYCALKVMAVTKKVSQEELLYRMISQALKL